jgi:hypothetical protein
MNEQSKRNSMLDVGTEASRIDDYVKRPMRHPYTDGLFELGLCVLLAGVPLLVFLNRTAPSNSIWHQDATFIVCIVALQFLGYYGQKTLRNRITYPRTGYVKYREVERRVWGSWWLAGGLALFSVSIFHDSKPHFFEIAAVALASAGWGVIYALGTRMVAAWRWIFLVAMIVGPPAVAMLPLGQIWSGTLPFVLQGLILAFSGTIALALYLRRNPLREQVGE